VRRWVARGAVARELTEHGERLQIEIRGEELVRQARWEIKREACLKALAIIDARWSHVAWTGPNGDALDVEKQDAPKIDAVRDCLNRLYLSCSSEEVPRTYKRCLGVYGSFDGAAISELRSAVREELEFGKLQNMEPETAFVGRLSRTASEIASLQESSTPPHLDTAHK
jgi:hypothetical protein